MCWCVNLFSINTLIDTTIISKHSPTLAILYFKLITTKQNTCIIIVLTAMLGTFRLDVLTNVYENSIFVRDFNPDLNHLKNRHLQPPLSSIRVEHNAMITVPIIMIIGIIQVVK